jgi:hypothetical protein
VVQILGVCASLGVSGPRDERIRAIAGVQHDRLTPRRFERAFDQALVNRVMYRQDVARLLVHTPGRRGSAAPLQDRLLSVCEQVSGVALPVSAPHPPDAPT